MVRILLLAAVVAVQSGTLLAADPAATAATPVAPFKRFQQVDRNIYRGGQPDAKGFAFLQKLGIRTVVSLREDDKERALVESLGMTWVHIPVTFHFLGGRMPPDAVATFMSILDDPARGAIFVHCRRGADRTGAFVALYRMVRQGWDLDRAYDEARALGMRWWFPKLKGELATHARSLNATEVAQVR